MRQPFGPPEASWVDFSIYEANGSITQIDVATYGIHTVGYKQHSFMCITSQGLPTLANSPETFEIEYVL